MPAGTAAIPVPLHAHAGIGSRLRARREALGMSVENIASLLKIAPPKVEAIEAERWDALPTEPYLSGFLRNYAKALRLDAEDLISRTAETAASPMQTPASVAALRLSPSFEAKHLRQPGNAVRHKRSSVLYWILAVVLSMGSILLWSETQSYRDLRARMEGFAASGEVARPGANGSTETPGSPETGAKSVDAAGASGSLVKGSGNASNRVAEAESRNDATTQPSLNSSRDKAQPKLAGARLRLQFSGDSWVQVAQADGTMLMSRLNSAKTETELSGTPPFYLIIGNAAAAKLQYRGEAVDLSPYIRGNVARLTLN